MRDLKLKEVLVNVVELNMAKKSKHSHNAKSAVINYGVCGTVENKQVPISSFNQIGKYLWWY